jgi:hypothetical protein
LTRQLKFYLDGSNPETGYLFLICSLLNDAAGSSDYAGSDDWVIDRNGRKNYSANTFDGLMGFGFGNHRNVSMPSINKGPYRVLSSGK